MSFIEDRLLDCVSYGTQGGPTWVTRRIGLKSGIIRRNAQRSRPLYRFEVVYSALRPSDHEAVVDAFNACRGGVYAFRLKDWSDFEADDELIGAAAGGQQTVQLSKLYEFGNQNVSRPIRKPVDGTVTLTANGSPLAADAVDYTTGEVTFTATGGHIIRWSGEFDVPVMFDTDELLFDATNRIADGLVLTANVPLLEDISA